MSDVVGLCLHLQNFTCAGRARNISTDEAAVNFDSVQLADRSPARGGHFHFA